MTPTITEPATLVTDWILAALALSWALRLPRWPDVAYRREWRRAFLLLALASFLGGAWHGFHEMLPGPGADLLWRATLAVSAGTALFLLRAGLRQFGDRDAGAWWTLAHLKFAAALATGFAWPDFLVVLADSAVSVLVVTGFVLAGGRRRTDEGRQFLAGVLLFALGATVQAAGLAPHPAFNHNDLFHLIQLAGSWMFFRCASR